MWNNRRKFRMFVITCVVIMFVSCAPGNIEVFNEGHMANFWHGIWHGFILLFTFIISLFNKEIMIYEVLNNGWPYNLGYLLGVAIFFGESRSRQSKKSCKAKIESKDWEEIAEKVEKKIKVNLKEWAESDKTDTKEWEEIGKKIEEKIKRVLKDWAEEV